MTFRLASEISGTGLVTHDTIGSTSADAMERLRADAAAPFWVTTDHQSAGRGRRGSSWSTPPGNLAASIGLRLDLPPSIVATLGFVAGLATVEALAEVAGGARAGLRSSPPSRQLESNDPAEDHFRLKWPNDVLADGAKLVGILLETEMTARGRAVVVGIGINVRHRPEGAPYAVASLASLGLATDAAAVFSALSSAWARAFALWDGGHGFGAIREMWLGRAHGLGDAVSIRSATGVIDGSFETIDPQGQMVVRLADGTTRAISAGDVHFGNAASLRAEAVA